MQVPASFAEYVDMTTVVVHIRRNAYQQKHLYESQLSHPFCIFRKGTISYESRVQNRIFLLIYKEISRFPVLLKNAQAESNGKS